MKKHIRTAAIAMNETEAFSESYYCSLLHKSPF